MRERPILFSGPLVRAILDGRKTQTRRLVTRQPIDGEWIQERGDGFEYARLAASENATIPLTCPYGQPGDTLYVRETFYEPHPGEVVYRADYPASAERKGYENIPAASAVTWRPSIHMPKWASRISLRVDSVRVERLQEISEEEANAEGVTANHAQPWPDGDPGTVGDAARRSFAQLWNDINGKRAPWESNPWVWVVSFERTTP